MESNNISHYIHLKYPNNVEKNVHIDDVLHELYYNLAIINENKYTAIEYKNLQKLISHNEDLIPLYDIFSKNIYLVNGENVFTRVIKFHYRLPNKNMVKKLLKTIESIDSSLTEYKEKLVKNINFIKNFDFDTLERTYYKLFYLSQPKIQEITSCLKPSFIPFITKKPYYTKTELINMALNMNIPITDNYSNLCKSVSKNDIDATIILSHQLYIKSTAKAYIQLYTLLGSYYWNQYIRVEQNRDTHSELQINRLYNIIRGSPSFNKQYMLYRFIDNDDYLSSIKINDIYCEESFISTTRNPFYDTKNNTFGFILIKIIIPKNVEGIGLCVESYSLFSGEEEILLGPSKLKLISKDTNYKYYHPDKKASKRIQKMYTFEFVEKLSLKNFDNYHMSSITIPTIDWLNSKAIGDDFKSKVYHFHKNVLPSSNNKRYFNSKIGDKMFLFHVFYLDDNPIYEKYFFLQKENNNSIDEIYFIIHDETTGEIILFIELRDIISVNYIHKFTGTPEQPYSDNELVHFISCMAHYFGINRVIIHDVYQSYLNISLKLLSNYDGSIFNESNPDNHIVSLYSGDFKYYNVNIINHINDSHVRFHDLPGIKSNLKKYQFKIYKTIDANELFIDIVKSPLYNLLIKLNKVNNHTNILDFYLYVHSNYFYMIKELKHLIVNYEKNTLLSSNIPWIESYTLLNSEEYLYENKLISSITTFNSELYHSYLKKLSEDHKNVSFNKFRLGLI